MAATGIYEWKDNKALAPGMPGAAPKSPTDPMGAPTQGQSSGSMFGATGANRAAAGATPSFGDMLKAGPAATGPRPSFNDLFQGVGDTRAQNLQGAQQAIGAGLQPQGPSQSGQLARNAFIKAQGEAERKVMEQAALGGRDETGQAVGDRRDYLQKQALPARMDFEAQLQAQEEQQAQARQQNAVGNLLAFEGLGEQSRATDAQNALAARGQDITARGQDIQERLGMADLSVREKELAQQGAQFKDELAFKKYATEGGWSQQEAGRVWESLENDKDRDLTKSESALGRTLQQYIADKGFDIDAKQLEENIRQFNGKMAFDQWATQAGLDDNEKARVWDGHLQDLRFKQETGERLGSQEHQVLLEDKRAASQRLAQEFEKAANLEVLGKTQEWDKAKMEIAEGYQQRRDTGQMSHEQAMQAVKADIETRLTQMGIDATAARQAAEIQAQQWTTERELYQQKALANAELMYKYASLRQEANISDASLDLKRQEIVNQVSQFADTLNLDRERVQRTLTMAENKEKWEIQANLMEMAGDDQDLVDLASDNFIKMLGQTKDPQGNALMTKEEVDAALKASKVRPAPTENNWATDDAFDQYGHGLGQISRGDIVDGVGNILTGAARTPISLVKDAGSGVVKAGKKVGKWLGF